MHVHLRRRQLQQLSVRGRHGGWRGAARHSCRSSSPPCPSLTSGTKCDTEGGLSFRGESSQPITMHTAYNYGTVDTYQNHGSDIRSRIELETPLSSLSGVQWSRNDIFRAPLGQNPVTRQGQPIVRVNLFNPQQTGMPAATLDELASVTLGSFQHRLVRSYCTIIR